MTDQQDELARTYARIIAMRVNLDGVREVRRNFGPEYDTLVDRAATASGRDLSEFKIGHDHRWEHIDAYHTQGFLTRLDGLLGYLRSLMPTETVDKIGFR